MRVVGARQPGADTGIEDMKVLKKISRNQRKRKKKRRKFVLYSMIWMKTKYLVKTSDSEGRR